jgi:hypothetical protein
MAKKTSYLPWIIGGVTAWFLFLKPKSIQGIGEIQDKNYLIGDFYLTSIRFLEKNKFGGNQKLQKIVGKHIYFKKGKEWFWNNQFIINWSIPTLQHHINLIKMRLNG